MIQKDYKKKKEGAFSWVIVLILISILCSILLCIWQLQSPSHSSAPFYFSADNGIFINIVPIIIPMLTAVIMFFWYGIYLFILRKDRK